MHSLLLPGIGRRYHQHGPLGADPLFGGIAFVPLPLREKRRRIGEELLRFGAQLEVGKCGCHAFDSLCTPGVPLSTIHFMTSDCCIPLIFSLGVSLGLFLFLSMALIHSSMATWVWGLVIAQAGRPRRREEVTYLVLGLDDVADQRCGDLEDAEPVRMGLRIAFDGDELERDGSL